MSQNESDNTTIVRPTLPVQSQFSAAETVTPIDSVAVCNKLLDTKEGLEVKSFIRDPEAYAALDVLEADARSVDPLLADIYLLLKTKMLLYERSRDGRGSEQVKEILVADLERLRESQQGIKGELFEKR